MRARSNPSARTGELAVEVTVENVDEPPDITGPASITVNEGHTGTVARYTATDPEGATVVWETLGGADADAFELSAGGVLTFKAVPDHEDQDEYEVRLRASDGDLTGTLDVTVSVTNVEEPGALALSSEQPRVGRR